jgi:hypothetical protein
VVSMGPFRRGSFGGGHDVILRSFQKFRRVFEGREWQLICMGEIESHDDLRYYQDFSYRAAAWQARCLAMPTPQQKREVLRRAKICISTNNWGISSEDEESMMLRFECGIGDALARACVPVVSSRGVEAEICEYLQLRFGFDALNEIEEQIALAASFAESDDLATQTQSWTDALSLAGFYEQWEKLLARGAQHPASSSAQE